MSGDESTAATETRVGHVKVDEIDVYVGRGPNGRHMLSEEDEITATLEEHREADA